MSAISIIMPCFNRAYDLLKVLRAYDCQNGAEPFELIAVDDCSSDATYDVLVSYHPLRYTLRIERLDKNQGQGMARNHAIPLVTSPLLVFVGDDMVPDPDFVQGHLDAHRTRPEKEIAILGRVEWPQDIPRNTLMTHIDGVGAQQFSYYYLRDGQEYDFRHFYTCNISAKSEFIQSLDHWFDSDFYLYGFEDVELGYRLKRRGLHIIYSQKMVVQHYHYYNIWTFARRQRNAGIMATVLLAKHPNLAYFFRGYYYRVLCILKHPRDLFSSFSSETLEQLEMLACRLSGFYEWDANSLLDRLYIEVLNYFFYDGFIQGLFAGSKLKQRLRLTHARRYLAPSLLSFLKDAECLGIPVPGGEYALLNRKIIELSLE
jgi:glycosyltransferase involved in cell wall biosynthesis